MLRYELRLMFLRIGAPNSNIYPLLSLRKSASQTFKANEQTEYSWNVQSNGC